MKASGYSSLLGIALEEGRMTAVVVQRANSRIHLRQAFESALPLERMSRDPERLGREIRERLDGAGIHERRCVVCIPLTWAYTLRTEVPPLSDNDVENFLNVQAEREFPFPPEELTLAISRSTTPDGTGQATLVAVPSNRLTTLCEALQTAKLRPRSITLGMTSLIEGGHETEEGRLVLLLGESSVDLAIALGETLLTLRSLDIPQESGPDVAEIARHIRITLGQLSDDLRKRITQVSVFGPAERVQPLLEGLCSLLGPWGITVEPGRIAREIQSEQDAPAAERNVALVEATAARLAGQPTAFEFLRVPSSRLKQLQGRVSSRSTLWLAGAAAALLLSLGGMLLVQHVRLSHLESQWADIEPKVAELKVLQEKVRRFRPWFDDTVPSLRVTRMLTEAFPEEGTVWMRSLEIKNRSEVSCAGLARSNPEWMAMLDRLRATPGVEDLQTLQVRGANPLQFSFGFRWDTGYRDES